MRWVALAAAGGAAGEPTGALDVVTAVLAWVGGIVAAYVGIVQARIAYRARVSGDAKEAREQEATTRSQTIEEVWRIADAREQARIQCMDRIATLERQHRADRDRILELEREQDEDRTVRMIHATWDWEAVEEMSRRGVKVRPAPPLVAQRPLPATED